jgi:hypothetical protein
MDREIFVDAIRRVVRDAAVADTLAALSQPQGRRPGAGVVGLSAWYSQLSPLDRERLERVIEMAADGAVFGFLCVLDGARAIDSEEGTLDLRYRKGMEDLSLNDEDGSPLHELL